MDDWFYGMTARRWLKLAGVIIVFAGFIIVPVWYTKTKASFRPCGPTWPATVEHVEVWVTTGANQNRGRRAVQVLGEEGQRITLTPPAPDVRVGDRVDVQPWCDAQGEALMRWTAERADGE